MKKREYSVDVRTTTFYVIVEAHNKEEAKDKVQKLLEEGRCTNEEDTTHYEVGNDIQIHN